MILMTEPFSQNVVRHLEMIQDVICRMEDNSFSIRRRSIGAAGALIGAAIKDEPVIASLQGPLAGKGLLDDLHVTSWFTRDAETQLPPAFSTVTRLRAPLGVREVPLYGRRL